MAENNLENNVESSNDDPKRNKNFQQNKVGGKKHFGKNQNSSDGNQWNGENNQEGNENVPKRYFVSRCENNINKLSYNSTLELPYIDLSERKFSVRSRIYIANISKDTTQDDLQNLFQPYGETAQFYISKEKKFAFLKMDYYANALKAIRELDGVILKENVLRVKLSPTAVVKVKNLVPSISSELLYYAFSPFGEIENATVFVDDRGHSTGEGIIDFQKKSSASLAVQTCKDKCYFLSYSLKPIIVEPFEIVNQTVGLLDKNCKRNGEFSQERSIGPRIAAVGSFEHEYGTRWKALYELFKQKEEALRMEFHMECGKLEAQMEYARFEHETDSLREQLRRRELDKERQKKEMEVREKQAEDEKLRAETHIRQTQDRLLRQQDEMRRRQEEAKLLMQAENLTSILDTQEHLDYDAPSSSTREMSVEIYNTYKKDSQNNNNPSDFNSWYDQSSWKKPLDGHWVREDFRGRGYQPKRRRF